MFWSLPAPHRLDCQCLGFAQGPHPRKSRTSSTTLSPARPTLPPSIIGEAQAVLGSYATALVGMENASSSGHATTVVEWHRAGFRLYWKWLSRARQLGGRKPVSQEIRALIFRMAAENPTWGAPRMHGELLKLGFHVSQPTVSSWLRRAPRSPDVGKRWLTFLRNHRHAIAAMDFFTVPTITFGVLYCFFVLARSRCEKRGPTRRCTDSCSLITTLSLAGMWCRRSGSWEASQCVPRIAALGRTVSRSGGWEAAEETCSIT